MAFKDIFKKYVYDGGESPPDNPPPPPINSGSPSQSTPMQSGLPASNFEKINYNYGIPPTDNNVIMQSAAVNMEVVKEIEKVLVEANFPGPDYIEFRNELKLVIGTPDVSESAAYNIAFNRWKQDPKSMNDPNKIIEAGKKYIQLLEKEKAEFEQAQTSSLGSKYSNNTIEINNLKRDNETLKLKITQQEARIQSLSTENGEIDLKVKKGLADFDSALHYVQSLINETIIKVQQYVKL